MSTLVACTAVTPAAPPAETIEKTSPSITPKTSPTHAQPTSPPKAISIASSDLAPVRALSPTINGITLKIVTFDSRTHLLKVVDQTAGPGSNYQNAQAAANSLQGLAAINAGFFTPQGQPLGFLVKDGKQRGSLNTSSLGSGVYQIKQNQLSLIKRQAYTSTNVSEALQSGPFIIRKSKAVKGLSSVRPRIRSILLTDGGHNWAIAQTSQTTLDNLASSLAGQSINNWNIKTALNLDGGRSCDLYIGPDIAGGPQTHRSFIAKLVRNFLVLVPR